ncbi:MAG TPA: phosphoenolpyruvate carboxylase [Chthoniobacteraceae bacterium]|jgi:phosphoenolpyruvate carboxylase|nr:phosphoenolpyruvate carboxylase [Chthoniobacteraceae bacterium]
MQQDKNTDYIAIGFEKIDRELQFLIGCLDEVLRSLGHEDLAELLPWTGRELPSDIEKLPAQTGLVFSIAFQLLNLVEENAAAQVRALREGELGMAAEPGLWGQALANLKERGLDGAQIAARLRSIRVEPVLTAHPTEAKRLSVLDQHRAIYQLVQQRERSLLTPTDDKRVQAQTRAALERLWRTGEILLTKPEIADERRNVLYYLRDVFPTVLPRLRTRMRTAWESAGFDPAIVDELGQGPAVRFGTWVGGDRDGHPGVTPEVTADTLERLRVNALIVLHRELTRLTETLTLSGWMQPLPAAMVAASKEMIEGLAGKKPSSLPAHSDEPWRDFVALMIEMLPVRMAPNQLASLRGEPGTYRYPGELKAHLVLLHDSLLEIGAGRLAAMDVRPVLRAVDTFGFHLADLDIRQNSAYHDKAIAQLLDASGLDGAEFGDWPENDRLTFLDRELRSPRPFLHANASAGPEADGVLGCFRVLAHHIEKYGTEGIGALIVSMTRRRSDLLAVYLLAREAGLTRWMPEGLTCMLPIVPLFETITDLERAPGILRGFLDHPATRSSLRFQQGQGELIQQVMVGYSDSNKDAGILASQWALHEGQARIAAVAEDCGVNIQFFHGRGGTVSRGAGPTNRFLEALPPGSLSGNIRLTEQGESIAQKFGSPSTATYNLELLVAGVTNATLAPASNPAAEAILKDICPPLAEASQAAYRKLLEAPGFIEFYRQATPIDALEHARIGSRPSRRTGQASLADLRAIPWVFSWNQARFYVPGWFGVGAGLQHLADHNEAAFRAVRENLRSSPFLYYVLTNVESSIASTDLDLMRAYATLVENEEVRNRIFGIIWEEWTRTRAMLQELRGQPTSQRRPRMMKTLQLRAEALNLLHLDQIRLLKRWRASRKEGRDAEAETMLPELFLSVNAIASGLRTTG